MSFGSLADAFAYVQCHDLTTNEVVTLLALANHANQASGAAYPSLNTLQRTTKLSRRATQYALRSLEEDKAIQTTPDASGHHVSTYRLLLPHVYPVHKAPLSSPVPTPVVGTFSHVLPEVNHAHLSSAVPVASANPGHAPELHHAPLSSALPAPPPGDSSKFPRAGDAPPRAPHASQPVIEPEKREKPNASEIYKTRAREKSANPLSPPLRPDDLLCHLDADTFAHLETEARTSLRAEGVTEFLIILPTVHSKMVSLWYAQQEHPGEGKRKVAIQG